MHSADSIDINALLEFSRLLNRSDDLARIYGTVLLSLMGKLGLAGAAVALPLEEAGSYEIQFARGGARKLVGERFTWMGEAEQCLLPVDPEEVHFESLRGNGIERLMPICFGDKIFGLVLFGRSLLPRGFGMPEENYSILIGAITAIAVEGAEVRESLRKMNRRLERRVRRLHSLFESSRIFGGLIDSNEILRMLGFTLMGEMAVGRFALWLRDSGGFRPVLDRFRQAIDHPMLDALCDSGTTLVSEKNYPALFALGVRASIALESQGETEGVLLLGTRLQFDYDEEDLEYIAALASLAIAALETARLLDEMIEKRRMEEDLRIASEIQRQLLPSVLPPLSGFEIAAATHPAREVGGDCYDAIQLPDGRILLAVADVSGKGTPASLLMANVQAALRALAPLMLPLGELAARVNDLIHDNTAADKFITAFLGLLDRDGTLHYVNAGHNPPYHVAGGRTTPLETGGLILGIMPTTIPYEVGTITLGPSDVLVVYTDGVTEAMNETRQEYGEDRLRSLVHFHDGRPAHELVDLLHEDVARFKGEAPQSDDITIIVVRRPAQ